MKTAYVYIMANAFRTMYVGVTTNLERRVWEHKTHYLPDSFTAKYDITRLVHVEEYANLDDAIVREKALKGKSRATKVSLIEAENPRWNDLAWDWFEEADIAADRAPCGAKRDRLTWPRYRPAVDRLRREIHRTSLRSGSE